MFLKIENNKNTGRNSVKDSVHLMFCSYCCGSFCSWILKEQLLTSYKQQPGSLLCSFAVSDVITLVLEVGVEVKGLLYICCL